jgi:hypothetical protein
MGFSAVLPPCAAGDNMDVVLWTTQLKSTAKSVVCRFHPAYGDSVLNRMSGIYCPSKLVAAGFIQTDLPDGLFLTWAVQSPLQK